jgi:hypothetical protein
MTVSFTNKGQLMATAKTKRISINDQVVAITQQTSKLRKSLDEKRSPETLEGFVTVASETDTSPLGEERQYGEPRALATRDGGNAEYLAEVKHPIEDDLNQFLAVTATSSERSD